MKNPIISWKRQSSDEYERYDTLNAEYIVASQLIITKNQIELSFNLASKGFDEDDEIGFFDDQILEIYPQLPLFLLQKLPDIAYVKNKLEEIKKTRGINELF